MGELSVITKGFCSKITSECDNRLKMLEAADATANAYLNNLKFGLAQVTTWSPHATTNKLKKSIAANIDKMVPNLEDFDELVGLINACVFTRKDKMLSKPSTIARGITSNIQNNAFTVLDSLATLGDTIIPEFSAAKLIDALKKQIKLGGFNIMVPELFDVMTCMNAICGTNTESRFRRLQSLLNKYFLNGTGELDVNALLASQNIHPDIIIHINTCVDQIEHVMTRIETSVSQGVDRIKRLVPEPDTDLF